MELLASQPASLFGKFQASEETMSLKKVDSA